MGLLITGVLVAGATFAIAALLVPLARWVAERFGIVDHPGTRKIHEAPMPRTGGIALFASFTGVVLAGYLAAPHLPALAAAYPALGDAFRLLRLATQVEGKLLAILIGATLVFVVGLIDDKLGTRFPVAVKAAGQVTAAAIVIAAGMRHLALSLRLAQPRVVRGDCILCPAP
jgi:UDP-GlcNAc:undecaprenyl-phosphate/decaprenyl-phosphate GlcNAc-1-phosphate transferase